VVVLDEERANHHGALRSQLALGDQEISHDAGLFDLLDEEHCMLWVVFLF
jgi:hypothetical protein